jgi:tryptophan-rich sensory protein
MARGGRAGRAAAGIGSLGARNAPQIYQRLQKPGWAPRSGAFGPVWTALYAGIGVAGWRLAGRGSAVT